MKTLRASFFLAVVVLDFADPQLRGIDHHRTFDQYPTEQNSATIAPK